MAVSKRVRYEVLRRDNNTCRYCHATDSPLTIDHVVPVALGGTDDPSNLVAACKDCNAGKTSSSPDAPLVAQVAGDAVRWSAAMKQAADRYVASRAKADAIHTFLFDEWESNNKGYRRGKAEAPDDFETSIDQWLRAGAPIELIEEAIGVAMRNKLVDYWNVWRYTCGVVWTRLGQMQEEAKESLRPPEPEPEDPDEIYWRGYMFGLMRSDVQTGHLWFKKLSQVVDGHYDWNRSRVDA